MEGYGSAGRSDDWIRYHYYIIIIFSLLWQKKIIKLINDDNTTQNRNFATLDRANNNASQ